MAVWLLASSAGIRRRMHDAASTQQAWHSTPFMRPTPRTLTGICDAAESGQTGTTVASSSPHHTEASQSLPTKPQLDHSRP
eukprot:1630238-Rhodomonas_salina.1